MKLGIWATILICWAATGAATGITNVPAQRVSETLETMQAAVLSGDSGAYMAQIDTDDPKFATEQRAWITDLSRHPVSEFRIEPLQELITGITGLAGMMHIRFHWTLQKDQIERSIEFNALFSPMSDEFDGPWLFSGRGWEIKLDDGSGLRVLADRKHKELAANVLEIAPGIQRSIEKNLKLTLSEPLAIKIYPTVQELQYSIAPGYINMLSGWNEPGESIKILGRSSISAERISSLLAHEIGHAVSFEYGPEIINAPWWSLEGISELVADEYRSTSTKNREISIAKQVARGDRRSWEQLSDFKGEALDHSMYVYAQGWSMVRHITQRYGKRARNDWFKAMGHGASVQEATLKVLKISFDDLDRQWESEMLMIAEQTQQAP